MGTTVFTAVQCCQCSTMQVKQQKKSGNKWTCVVCNQKQSVRKVFAQGFMAKDLRKFVQSFNMSQHSHSQTLGTAFPQHDDYESKPPNLKPKRNDWNEYLDIEEQRQEEEEVTQESEGEMKVVTELPKEMFNKRSLKDSTSSSSSQLCGQGNKLNNYRPVFSKRQKTNNADGVSSDESRKCQQISLGKSKWADNDQKDDIQPKNHQMTATAQPSRWCLYLDEEDNDLQFGSEKTFSNVTGQGCNGLMDNSVSDRIVEEDIHPDFL